MMVAKKIVENLLQMGEIFLRTVNGCDTSAWLSSGAGAIPSLHHQYVQD